MLAAGHVPTILLIFIILLQPDAYLMTTLLQEHFNDINVSSALDAACKQVSHAVYWGNAESVPCGLCLTVAGHGCKEHTEADEDRFELQPYKWLHCMV